MHCSWSCPSTLSFAVDPGKISRSLNLLRIPPSIFHLLLLVYRYCPSGAERRNPEEIFITGETAQGIAMAKTKIHELVSHTRLYMKDAMVSPAKIDSIILTRLDKVKKIMETNGTFILFPQLASQRNLVRIQGVEGLHVERTVRDIMGLVSCPPNPPVLATSLTEI
jgi:hypothetical protein